MAKYGEEKPAAIIDDTDYAYTFYYILVSIRPTVPLVLNFTNTGVQKVTARNIDRNAPE